MIVMNYIKKKINTKSKTELVQIYPFPKEAN